MSETKKNEQDNQDDNQDAEQDRQEDSKESGGNSNSESGLGKNVLEWSVFAVSLLLVGATLFYLGREMTHLEDSPPRIILRLGQPRALQNTKAPRFIVRVTAVNKGRQTAEGVHVAVEMQRPNEEAQSADFEIDFLPRGSSREGWVVFDGKSGNAKLDARVLGYQIP